MDEWWRSVKAKIDSGLMLKDTITVTGSASLDLLKQKEHFPGRRGNGVDLIQRPRGFRTYVLALGGIETITDQRGGGSSLLEGIEKIMSANKVYDESLETLFTSYLETGGFPLPIKEKVETGSVQESSRKALLDGLRSDWLKYGKSEKAMKEVIGYLLSARGSPISWLGISKSTSIASHNTARNVRRSTR